MNTRLKKIIFTNQVVLSENLNVSLLIFQELIHQHALSMAQLDPDDNSKKQPCNVMLVVEISKKEQVWRDWHAKMISLISIWMCGYGTILGFE